MSEDFVRRLPQSERAPQAQPLIRVKGDWLLTVLLAGLVAYGLVVLWSAADQSSAVLVNQALRAMVAFILMLLLAQIPPTFYRRWTPWVWAGGCVLLGGVIVIGVEVNGSQRWLDLPGLPRFQPSELMKLAVPLGVAWYLADRSAPHRTIDLVAALGILGVPGALIVIQPDLGTSILVTSAGLAVLWLSGLQWRWVILALALALASAPVLWSSLREYQQQRILTLFDPERDPLGAGWNIIQSKTAIGSGGLWGKGLLDGTQSHLDFLPEASTDFIIAVLAEELGFVGVAALMGGYLVVLARALIMTMAVTDSFGRLIAGGVTFTFFVYAFVNIAMVSGLLPVVGVPLPLISYGGTSMLTLLAGFGILMSVHGHRRIPVVS